MDGRTTMVVWSTLLSTMVCDDHGRIELGRIDVDLKYGGVISNDNVNMLEYNGKRRIHYTSFSIYNSPMHGNNGGMDWWYGRTDGRTSMVVWWCGRLD
jgi:hypothetical protein